MCAAQELAVERTASEGAAVELGLPGTFAARGVRVPFTTPALDGACVRLSPQGGGRAAGARLEMLLPNPSGRGGVYVIEWGTIPRICAPTLFDRDVVRRVAALPALTPDSVRGAIHRAGATGLAGEAVSEAASHAAAAARQERLAAHVALLMALIRQGEERYGREPAAEASTRGGAGSALAGIEHRARCAITALAADLALPEGSSEALGRMVEDLASPFAGIGLGPQAEDARLPRLQREVARLAHEAGQAAATGCEEARMVAQAATVLARAGGEILRAARARAGDVARLVRDWSRDPANVVLELTRAEWLFDGWDRPCASRRQLSSDGAWRALAAQLPTVPGEVASWSAEFRTVAADMRRMQRRPASAEDWRMGVALADLVAENEKTLAQTLGVASVRGPAGTEGIAA